MKKVVVLLSLITSAGFAQSCLVTDSMYAFGNSPHAAAYADFNGDWVNDMVVTYPNTNRIKVSMNNGFGVYLTPTNINAGTKPMNLVAADVSSDSYPDIICANTASNDLTIYINNGFGTFTSSTMALGFSPFALALMDIDGDWITDLLVSNGTNGQFTSYINNGFGLFAVGATFTAPNKINSMVALDFDWDGAIDLVTANASNVAANSVSVFMGNAGGGFAAPVNYATSTPFATDIVLADVDADWYSDIIVSTNGYTIEVLKNNQAGVFTPGFVYNSSPNKVQAIAIADINSDNANDIAFSDSSNNSIAILINNGVGNFPTKIYPSPLTGGTSVSDISFADLNGDYVNDIGAVMTGTNRICTIMNYDGTIWYQFFSPVCENDPAFLLDAFPQGGIFYVNGVQQNIFNPAVYGPGTHTIVYVYNPQGGACIKMDTTFMVVVPANAQALYNEVNNIACTSMPGYQLTPGTPPGGFYSGPGVTGNTFNPAAAGIGQHIITYSFQNCGGSDTSLISVVTSPVDVTLALEPSWTCLATPAFALSGGLPVGGTYSGTGVSNGIFTPATAGVGNHFITYSFTDVNSGCTDFEMLALYVSPCLVSVDELSKQKNLRIAYSNNDAQLIVSASEIIQRIELFDMNGKNVGEATVSATNYSMPVSNIAQGLYYVKVLYNDQSGAVKKFVKL
jgi:hypothetical protein